MHYIFFLRKKEKKEKTTQPVGKGEEVSTSGKKKEKKPEKETLAKAPPAKAEPSSPVPSMIDMRVGKILEAMDIAGLPRSGFPDAGQLCTQADRQHDRLTPCDTRRRGSE